MHLNGLADLVASVNLKTKQREEDRKETLRKVARKYKIINGKCRPVFIKKKSRQRKGGGFRLHFESSSTKLNANMNSKVK